MMLSRNEKYLLKFISNVNKQGQKQEDILSAIQKLGIKIKFSDFNPVYQIIDEMQYYSYSLKK